MEFRVAGRDTEPKAWAALTEDGLREFDTLDEAVPEPGVIMRRYSAARIEQRDGTAEWSATYRRVPGVVNEARRGP